MNLHTLKALGLIAGGGDTLSVTAVRLLIPLGTPIDVLSDPIDRGIWRIWFGAASAIWNVLDRTILMAALQVNNLHGLISMQGGLLDQLAHALLGAEGGILLDWMRGALMLALTLTVITYALRIVLGRNFELVNLGGVFVSFALVGWLVTDSGAIHTLVDVRSGLESAGYATALTINPSGGYNIAPNEIPNQSGEPYQRVVHFFPTTTGPNITGMDAAAAYLLARSDEVNGTMALGLPLGAIQQYYINGGAVPWPDGCDSACRQQALGKAQDGAIRMGSGTLISAFAAQQATISLILSLVELILLLGLIITLPFAMFKYTAAISSAVLQGWIRLTLTTFIMSTVLGLSMGFLRYWADQHNPNMVIAVASVIFWFTRQYAKGALQLLMEAVNLVPQALGAATGLQMERIDPVASMRQFAQAGVTIAGMAAAPLTGGASLALAGAANGMLNGSGGSQSLALAGVAMRGTRGQSNAASGAPGALAQAMLAAPGSGGGGAAAVPVGGGTAVPVGAGQPGGGGTIGGAGRAGGRPPQSGPRGPLAPPPPQPTTPPPTAPSSAPAVGQAQPGYYPGTPQTPATVAAAPAPPRAGVAYPGSSPSPAADSVGSEAAAAAAGAQQEAVNTYLISIGEAPITSQAQINGARTALLQRFAGPLGPPTPPPVAPLGSAQEAAAPPTPPDGRSRAQLGQRWTTAPGGAGTPPVPPLPAGTLGSSAPYPAPPRPEPTGAATPDPATTAAPDAGIATSGAAAGPPPSSSRGPPLHGAASPAGTHLAPPPAGPALSSGPPAVTTIGSGSNHPTRDDSPAASPAAAPLATPPPQDPPRSAPTIAGATTPSGDGATAVPPPPHKETL